MKKLLKRSSFLRIFSFMKKNLAGYIIGILFLSIIGLLVQILMATMFMHMFDFINAGDFSAMLDTVKKYGLFLLIMFAIYPLFIYITMVSAAKTTGNIRKKIFEHIHQLPIAYFEAGHSGDLISRMTNDIAEMKNAYSDIFIQFATRIITGIGTTIYMFMIEWRMALLAVIGGVITAVINTYYARILKNISREVQEKLANLTEELSNILAGIKVIKTFNLYQKILNKYTNKNDDVYQKSYERVNKRAIMSGFNAFGGIFSFVGLIALGSYLAIKGHITIGVIIAVVQLQNGINMLVRTLGNMISEIQGSLAAADRVYEVLDYEKEPESYLIDKKYKENMIDKEKLKSDVGRVDGDEVVKKKLAVVLSEVTFSYTDKIKTEVQKSEQKTATGVTGADKNSDRLRKSRDSQNIVLQNLNFNVERGSMVALAGPSGGGKSTIFKLLLNFYPPEKGNIIIDGKSISEQNIGKIRDKIAYVPQDAYLFAGTIKENIAYGKKDACEAEIIKAAKVANADQFIRNLEKGYETMVGERGTHLSGGQRQRIAIARAVLKDADILLLDEATSSLDTESEKLVQDALNNLMKGRTTLVIAHRLATIQDADKILVLKDGKIVERGCHEELLKLEEGVYRKLYDQQFEVA